MALLNAKEAVRNLLNEYPEFKDKKLLFPVELYGQRRLSVIPAGKISPCYRVRKCWYRRILMGQRDRHLLPIL